MDRAFQAIKRKLEAAELEHLRRHVSELQARLEQAEERAALAEEHAESWREAFFDFQEQVADELEAAGKAVGLTKDGAILVVDAGASS